MERINTVKSLRGTMDSAYHSFSSIASFLGKVSSHSDPPGPVQTSEPSPVALRGSTRSSGWQSDRSSLSRHSHLVPDNFFSGSQDSDLTRLPFDDSGLSSAATNGEAKWSSMREWRHHERRMAHRVRLVTADRAALCEEKVRRWLKKHSPIGELSRLPLSIRKAIGKRRPNTDYDILPRCLQSGSFVVQFDMENPRLRFVILHRTAKSSYSKLPMADKAELVRVGLGFAEWFQFNDTLLSIPLGTKNQTGVIYNTFYAYLLVRNRASYMELFDTVTASNTLPHWPSTRWVTPMWIQHSDPFSDPTVYNESLTLNSALFPDCEFSYLTHRGVLLKTTDLSPKTSEACKFLSTFSWSAKSLIGVRSTYFENIGSSPVDRWQLTAFLCRQVTPFLKEKRFGCYMVLSLGNMFSIRNQKKVLAFLRFDNRIPDALLSPDDDTRIDEPHAPDVTCVTDSSVSSKEHLQAFLESQHALGEKRDSLLSDTPDFSERNSKMSSGSAPKAASHPDSPYEVVILGQVWVVL